MPTSSHTQALLQVPLNSRENFKPGAGLNLNAGLRYTANETFVPQLQALDQSPDTCSG